MALVAWLLAAGVILSAGVRAAGQELVDSRREYNVKAVSLYGFGRYVTWPNAAFADDSGPFVLAVFGDIPFDGALERIAEKKTIQGRPLQIVHLTRLEDLGLCQILFVGKSVDRATETTLLRSVRGRHVLVAGETEGFAQRGGTINFVIQEGNVRFELNVDAARDAHLALNAKLYSIALPVSSGSRPVSSNKP